MGHLAQTMIAHFSAGVLPKIKPAEGIALQEKLARRAGADQDVAHGD